MNFSYAKKMSFSLTLSREASRLQLNPSSGVVPTIGVARRAFFSDCILWGGAPLVHASSSFDYGSLVAKTFHGFGSVKASCVYAMHGSPTCDGGDDSCRVSHRSVSDLIHDHAQGSYFFLLLGAVGFDNRDITEAESLLGRERPNGILASPVSFVARSEVVPSGRRCGRNGGCKADGRVAIAAPRVRLWAWWAYWAFFSFWRSGLEVGLVDLLTELESKVWLNWVFMAQRIYQA